MRWIGLVVGVLATGCGYLSNDVFFDGVGQVRGEILLAGEPVEGALVFAADEDGVLDKAQTDADGKFAVTARAGRSRRLVAMWGGFAGLQEPFELTVDSDRNLGSLQIEAFGELYGTVSLQSQAPDLVELHVVGTDWYARPNRDGDFKIYLPGGTWDIELSGPGVLTERLTKQRVQSGQRRHLGQLELAENPEFTCAQGVAIFDRYLQAGSGEVDVLFVIDNSRSMVGEQLALAQAFENFTALLEGAAVDYRIAVVTTGMESQGCGPCPPDNPNFYSCTNETGENGRFQDRLGQNIGSIEDPEFDFLTDPTCRVVEGNSLDCFFDQAQSRGISLVGVNGCGYERGLAAVRSALNDPLLTSWNADFLRPNARLAVVVVSDEEDCGEVGDVTEGVQGISGKVCYYAAKGTGPDGSSVDPQEGRIYDLTPVEDYAAFLWGLKPSPSLVTFSAIVGVEDPGDPLGTTIRYASADPTADVLPACSTPNCSSQAGYCEALPGTRYIALADMLGGAIASICQNDFSAPLNQIAGVSTGFRRVFPLSRPARSADTIAVRVQGLLAEGWSYDPTGPAIVFPEGGQPPLWSAIEIEFVADCP